MESLIDLLPILIPFLVIELGVRIYCIIDVNKPEREVLLVNKTVWTVLIALVTFAWVVYLLGGKKA